MNMAVAEAILDRGIDREISAEIVRLEPNNPVAAIGANYRSLISKEERRLAEMEEAADISIRGLEGDLAEAKREYEERSANLKRQISEIKEISAKRTADCRLIIASGRAALAALEGNTEPVELKRGKARAA